MRNLFPDSDFLPNTTLPHLWADFNARGWSGEPDDDCYYTFSTQQFEALTITGGLRVFLYMDEGMEGTAMEIVGMEAVFEYAGNGWRARPDSPTYWGKKWW